MHDEINLSYIGLSELEIRVIKSMFTLAPELNQNYSLIAPDRLTEADVILVNADDPAALQLWDRLSQANRASSALMVSDDEDHGSDHFTIKRPIRVQRLIGALEDIVAQTQTSFESEEPAAAEEIRILVVDDSYSVRKYMENKLNELAPFPVSVFFASDGEEAIDLAARGRYDIIFMDVMMEGVDGYRACKTIKARGEAYIVMLTSKKSPFDKVRGTMSGCDAYVTKPPGDDRLAEEIQKCLSRRPGLDRGARANAG